jgi:c-di-GMP-related signal transduction protein
VNAFIARQPIFDRELAVVGYELLFRSGFEECFSCPDPDRASSKVIADSLFLPRLDTISRGRKAFINVTREALIRDWITLLPPATTVVEILEDVDPDREVLDACARLHGAGYRLALDDYVEGSRWESWLDRVDILKVDTLAARTPFRTGLARRFARRGPDLLAEKIETQKVYRELHGLGYGMFQGFFFARPTIVPGRDIPASQLHRVELLREIHRTGLDFYAIADIIEREVGLSYKLLRYLNAAFFAWRGPVASIPHALMLLGEREIRTWATIVVMASMPTDKPDELVGQALVRGRLCELLAAPAGFGDRAPDLFLLGAFSLIDALLDYPLEAVLEEIPIAPDVKGALLGEAGPLRDLLELATAYGDFDWEVVSAAAARLSIDEGIVPDLYVEALEWCDGTRAVGEAAAA